MSNDSSDESESDEEFDFVSYKMQLRVRGDKRSPARVEGYIVHTILRMTNKTFREHFG